MKTMATTTTAQVRGYQAKMPGNLILISMSFYPLPNAAVPGLRRTPLPFQYHHGGSDGDNDDDDEL